MAIMPSIARRNATTEHKIMLTGDMMPTNRIIAAITIDMIPIILILFIKLTSDFPYYRYITLVV